MLAGIRTVLFPVEVLLTALSPYRKDKDYRNNGIYKRNAKIRKKNGKKVLFG